MTGMFFSAQQSMCGLVPYRDAETPVPATFGAASSELYRATSAKLARRYGQ
jgi:hypothetical protein